MEEKDFAGRLARLESRALRLERWLKLTNSCWLVAAAIVALAAWTNLPRAAQGQGKTMGVVRVRQLLVIDDKGVSRIAIGPVPDPQMSGVVQHRRSPATGIQFNDALGNERGGLGMLEDGSMIVGIDDQKGQERAHLYFIPKRGSGLLLQDSKGVAKISLAVPPDGQASPSLQITSATGKTVFSAPSRR